jgi:hypothetical protein
MVKTVFVLRICVEIRLFAIEEEKIIMENSESNIERGEVIAQLPRDIIEDLKQVKARNASILSLQENLVNLMADVWLLKINVEETLKLNYGIDKSKMSYNIDLLTGKVYKK